MSVSKKPIIVALDYSEQAAALQMASLLDPQYCRVKVGKELFTRAGPAVVETLQKRGFEVFLDLKFHDIPNTTAMAVKAAAELDVWMVNVHASGGRRMMEAAANVLSQKAHNRTLLIAVTVLTSMEKTDLEEIGIELDLSLHVERLAHLTAQSGLDGVVCSAQEAPMLRKSLPTGFCLVTPGIRPVESVSGDQKRIMTPVEALRHGSDYLVIGRPITQAKDPADQCRLITLELSEAGYL